MDGHFLVVFFYKLSEVLPRQLGQLKTSDDFEEFAAEPDNLLIFVFVLTVGHGFLAAVVDIVKVGSLEMVADAVFGEFFGWEVDDELGCHMVEVLGGRTAPH